MRKDVVGVRPAFRRPDVVARLEQPARQAAVAALRVAAAPGGRRLGFDRAQFAPTVVARGLGPRRPLFYAGRIFHGNVEKHAGRI